MSEPDRATLDYAIPPAPPAPVGGRAAAGWLFAALLLGGVACPMQAMMLFEVGRGSRIVYVCCLAAITSPLSAVAWRMRRSIGGKVLAAALVAVALGADAVIAAAPRLEGEDYFRLSWSRQSWFLAGWFGTWGIWQVLCVGAVLSRTRPSSVSGVTDEA
jgi:hypothetical protein